MEEAGHEIVQFGQGFASMSGPMKELEKLVLSKGLAHGGNPVLTWIVSLTALFSLITVRMVLQEHWTTRSGQDGG